MTNYNYKDIYGFRHKGINASTNITLALARQIPQLKKASSTDYMIIDYVHGTRRKSDVHL